MDIITACFIFGILGFALVGALVLWCIISFARDNARQGKEPFDFTDDPPPLDDDIWLCCCSTCRNSEKNTYCSKHDIMIHPKTTCKEWEAK